VASDKAIGWALFIISILVIIIYGYLVFFTSYTMIVLEITAFVLVAGVFGIVAWIGFTVATTPPPEPVVEIEESLREEIERIEKEVKEEGEGKE